MPPLRSLAALLVLMLPSGLQAEGTVVLTFDVEEAGDAEAFARFDIPEPATYFFTGEYAREHPGLVRRLGDAGNTIGSHSHYHDDLATLDPERLALDLELSRRAVEEIVCRPVEWFRAPFLSYGAATMDAVAAAGLRYDSSDKAPWPVNPRLPEMAISVLGDTLVTDIDAVAEAEAAAGAGGQPLLIRAFEASRAEGRPLVILMHPRIIGTRQDLLEDFLVHARAAGAEFLTAEELRLHAMAGTERRALWLDDLPGVAERPALIDRLRAERVSDLVLAVPDPEDLPRDLIAALPPGVRVGLAVDLFDGGTPWPGDPAVRGAGAALARLLAAEAGIDAVVLTGLDRQIAPAEVTEAERAAFAADRGLETLDPAGLPPLEYVWRTWRARRMAALIGEVRAGLAAAGRPDLGLAAEVPGDALLDFRVAYSAGLEPLLAGPHLDAAYVRDADLDGSEDPAREARLGRAGRVLLGRAALMLGQGEGALLLGGPARPVAAAEDLSRLPISCLARRAP